MKVVTLNIFQFTQAQLFLVKTQKFFYFHFPEKAFTFQKAAST